MNRNLERLAAKTILTLAVLAGGCQFQPATAPPDDAQAETDPCAERLHDLCGQLLLYYSIHDELPRSLAELPKTGAAPAVCPVSGKPYGYDRQGIQVVGWPGRLIVYDAEPCHDGLRWGILADAPRPGKPLVVRVARPPENAIRWQDRQGNP